MVSRRFRHVVARTALAAMVVIPAYPVSANSGGVNPPGPSPEAEATVIMDMRADEFIAMAADGRMVVKGRVEVYYNHYVLTADQLVYDPSAGELQALGNVYVKEPDGAEITATRIILTDEFRDAFLRSFPDASRKPR